MSIQKLYETGERNDMARPIKQRRICGLPMVDEFAPCEGTEKGVVELTVDEYEVIRLIDRQGLNQNECAVQMQVARTTVQAIYDSARGKLAEFLIDGKRLKIRGGCYDVCAQSENCKASRCGKACGRKQCQESGMEGCGCCGHGCSQ